MHLAENHSHGSGSGPLSSIVDEPKVQLNIAEPDVISSVVPAHLREKAVELPLDPSDGSPVEEATSPTPQRNVSKAAGITVIVTLAGISFLNTMGSGILIAALPTMARDVGLAQGLMLWPASVYALAAGALLLIFGAAADVVGAKLMWVTGSFLFIAFTLGIGFAQTGIQLILFRTFQGVAIAMCLPTAVSLITNTFPKGQWRNMAFAMNGMGQPLGYSLGLVLGGIFTDTIGWRWAYYLMAIINVFLSVASLWSLPTVHHHSEKRWTTRLAQDIDWVGAIIMSVGLALLFYVLAAVSTSYISLGYAQNIALLVVALVLILSFPLWMDWQKRHGRPALIPNQLWRNAKFTTICSSVFLCWASLNAIEYYITLYFQEVEGVSPLQSSLRFLPHPIAGTATNIATAYLISRVEVRTLGVVSGVVTMIAPILMATVRIGENYWTAPFFALLLSPLNPDVLFTASNLVISDAFPSDVQSVAGGVFNEVAQFGNAVGLAVTAAIASSVTDHSHKVDPKVALMDGYRAGFWTVFAATALVVVLIFFGLKRGGTVGKKDD
ncbi:major facilitator superfamily domain-containing protein [Ustulina deusta]|nr:major facilitator superfamily domain-containing protein [Ustulina deusta]